jgi:hypothetical protein
VEAALAAAQMAPEAELQQVLDTFSAKISHPLHPEWQPVEVIPLLPADYDAEPQLPHLYAFHFLTHSHTVMPFQAKFNIDSVSDPIKLPFVCVSHFFHD